MSYTHAHTLDERFSDDSPEIRIRPRLQNNNHPHHTSSLSPGGCWELLQRSSIHTKSGHSAGAAEQMINHTTNCSTRQTVTL